MTALKEYITDGLKWGTLQRSEAPDACSFFFIDKKDGKLCPVQDYRPLNAITRKNAAPILLIPELINKLLEAQFFTKLDIHWGYNNICIWEGDEYKMAFKTPLSLYKSRIMTFGLCNAPATFQTFMDTKFADFLETGKVVIYLDDILIMATTIVELVKLTHRILQRLLDLDLYLRPEKCSFNWTSVEYLGLIISEGELHMDLVKLTAVTNWPTLKTMKEVQKFLGFCNFYRHFIKNYSALAQPLFNLTKKDVPFYWDHTEEQAFCDLQSALTLAPVLILPDYEKPFTLITDASDYTTGSILEQEDAFGCSHPVAYFSKSLQPMECNYEIHDKELLTIIHSLKHFCHYLQGNKHRTKIFSDHANLQYFTTKQYLTCRQSCWALFLATYDFIIIPKPGKLNKADALSRHPDYKEGIASENADQILLTMDKFLLTPDTFQICTLHNMAIPTGMDLDLKAALQEGINVTIQFCPHFSFLYRTSFSVTWPWVSPYLLMWPMSHGQSPDRSLDHLSHERLIVLTVHCSIVLPTYCSCSPLSLPYCSRSHCSPKAIVRLLRTLSQVAASVVYKLACIIERGLKPDLVFYPSVVAPPNFLVCPSSLSLSHLPLGRLKVLWDSPFIFLYPKTSVLGKLVKALPTSLRVPVPCDHLRHKTTCARRTLRPLDLNNQSR